MNTQPRTLCEAFQKTASAHPEKVALRNADGSVEVTWREYADRVRRIAGGLAALGVKPGDTVALMMTNRPEFHIVDTAVMHLGATPFSMYNTLAADQVSYLYSNAENRVVICEEQFLQRLRAADTAGQVQSFVCIDGAPEGTTSLADLEEMGDPGFDFEAAWRAIDPTTPLTIIYTSGTTGPPKGVELTHANLLAEFAAVDAFLEVDHDDRVISYLPDAHIANRGVTHYANIIKGIQITTLANPNELISALPQVRPTSFLAVPAIWYKVKAGIEAKIAAEEGAKRKLATWAIETGTKVAWLKSARKPIPPHVKVQHALADKLVLSKLRAKMGLDAVRVALTGAAPIAPDAMAFILGLGLPVCEVWGMSETSGAATLNPPDAIKIGSVGKVVPGGTEVTLADDGELLVRGPIVMNGYRRDPDRTAEAIDSDGWMHTGDIATVDSEGYFTIVDRKKELIINSAGKNLSPSNIEGTIKVAVPLAGSIVAIGDEKPYITALLTLDPDACAAYAAKAGLKDPSPAVLAEDPGVLAMVEAGIKAANEKLSRVEQIKKFKVLPTVWEPGGEEITPTMKLKRKPIAAKYAAEIDALYSA